jgi:hypothetical protein
MFMERGADFFDGKNMQQLKKDPIASGQEDDGHGHDSDGPSEARDPTTRTMTSEELLKMRVEILPQL